RSSLDEYRVTNRGGKGVKTLNITEKTGKLVSINNVTDADDLMIINKSGLTIRMAVEDLRVMGRATQGVKLINIKGNDSIAAGTKVMKEEEDVALEAAMEEMEGADKPAVSDSLADDISDNDEDSLSDDNLNEDNEE